MAKCYAWHLFANLPQMVDNEICLLRHQRAPIVLLQPIHEYLQGHLAIHCHERLAIRTQVAHHVEVLYKWVENVLRLHSVLLRVPLPGLTSVAPLNNCMAARGLSFAPSPRLCPEPPSRMNSLYIDGWKAFDDSLRVPVQTTKQRRPDGTCDKCERRPYSSLKRCMMTAYLQRLAGIAARFRVSRTTKSKKKKSSGRVSGMRRRGSGMKDPESGIRFLGSLSGHLHHTYAPAFAFASASTYRWASLFIYLC